MELEWIHDNEFLHVSTILYKAFSLTLSSWEDSLKPVLIYPESQEFFLKKQFFEICKGEPINAVNYKK